MMSLLFSVILKVCSKASIGGEYELLKFSRFHYIAISLKTKFLELVSMFKDELKTQ